MINIQVKNQLNFDKTTPMLELQVERKMWHTCQSWVKCIPNLKCIFPKREFQSGCNFVYTRRDMDGRMADRIRSSNILYPHSLHPPPPPILPTQPHTHTHTHTVTHHQHQYLWTSFSGALGCGVGWWLVVIAQDSFYHNHNYVMVIHAITCSIWIVWNEFP